MSYFIKNRDRSNKKKWFPIFIVGIIIVVILLLKFVFPNLTPKLFSAFATPMWRAGDSVLSEASVVTSLATRSKVSLIQENEALKSLIREKDLLITSMQVIANENQAIRELFGWGDTSDSKVLAGVLSAPPRSPYDVLIIDAGEKQGVQLGGLVFASERSVIGKVSEVYGSSSKVEMFSTAQQKTDALIERSNTKVVLEGRGGGDFSIELPKGADVIEGDHIVMLGINNYLLATVKAIDDQSANSFITIFAEIPTSISYIRFVLIGKANEEIVN